MYLHNTTIISIVPVALLNSALGPLRAACESFCFDFQDYYIEAHLFGKAFAAFGPRFQEIAW